MYNKIGGKWMGLQKACMQHMSYADHDEDTSIPTFCAIMKTYHCLETNLPL